MTIEEMIARLQAMLHEGTEDNSTLRHLYVDVHIDGKMQTLLVEGVARDEYGYDVISVVQQPE